MEDVFREIKERVQIERVCELLGINLNRSHKALCPFPEHNEKTPSFSVSPSKNIFYCFGCNKKGDSITLVSEMLNIRPFEAAVFLNNNLGLGVEIGSSNNYTLYNEKQYKKKNTTEKQLKEWEKETFIKLTNKYHRLKRYEKIMSKLFSNYPELYFNDVNIVYYLQNKEKMEYFIGRFIELDSDDANEVFLLKKQMKGGKSK